jgi:hypothetical protein
VARIRNRSSNAIPRAAAKISETKRRQRIRARNRGRTLSTNPKRNNGRIRAVCAALYGSTDIPREVVRCARLWTRILRFSANSYAIARLRTVKKEIKVFFYCVPLGTSRSSHFVSVSSMFVSLPCYSNPLLLGTGRDSALYNSKKTV